MSDNSNGDIAKKLDAILASNKEIIKRLDTLIGIPEKAENKAPQPVNQADRRPIP